MIHADEADQQHVDEVYEAAQEGLFDRDRETRHMLDGVHATGSPPSSGPPMRTNGTSGTPPGGAPSAGGSPGDGPGGPPRLARPSAQTMLRRLASGAETPSEGTSAEAEDVLQTAQLQGACIVEFILGYEAGAAGWLGAVALPAAGCLRILFCTNSVGLFTPSPNALQTANLW